MSKPKTYFEPLPPSPMKAQFLPLFNVNLSQPQLNTPSTQFQLNFDSTSAQPQLNLSSTPLQPQPQINLHSTSTQYGCEIKANQSCRSYFLPMLSISPEYCKAV